MREVIELVSHDTSLTHIDRFAGCQAGLAGSRLVPEWILRRVTPQPGELWRPVLTGPSILEPVPAPITWMVMSRDVSQSIRVVDQAVAIAVMILDVDTGLIRGLSVAEDIPEALSQSVERALTKPADTLPPGYPQRVLAAVGLGDYVAVELGRQPGLNLIPPIDEIVPGDEAEEIFDSFVEAFS